jgi:curved DNA-binding protein CbpA
MAHYAVLGVPFDANTETIHHAYRRLARKYHPDAGTGSSPERFRAVAGAYQTLGDPAKRESYDRQLLHVSGPRPEPLIPHRTRPPVLWPREPDPNWGARHFDTFVAFEQVFERVFMDFEALFSEMSRCRWPRERWLIWELEE